MTGSSGIKPNAERQGGDRTNRLSWIAELETDSRSSWSTPVRGLLGTRAEIRSRLPSSRKNSLAERLASRNAHKPSRSSGLPGRSVASPTHFSGETA